MPGTDAVNAFIDATLRGATPLILAAMGGVLSERAGVVNIALEGLMLTGAFVAVWAGVTSGAVGLLTALVVGGLLGLLHAVLTQRARMDHVVSGLGINLLAAGVTRYLSLRYFPTGIRVNGLPYTLFLALALLMPILVTLLLWRTHFGLRLRAVGESAASARMAGIAPGPPRYAAVTISGMLAALAGAYLSLADSHTFTSNMSSGKGYIALAAVIFGKWNPFGAMGGALFFGFFYALQTQLQMSNIHANLMGVDWTSPFLLDTLPYVMTLAALVSVVGRAVPPADLGRQDQER